VPAVGVEAALCWGGIGGRGDSLLLEFVGDWHPLDMRTRQPPQCCWVPPGWVRHLSVSRRTYQTSV